MSDYPCNCLITAACLRCKALEGSLENAQAILAGFNHDVYVWEKVVEFSQAQANEAHQDALRAIDDCRCPECLDVKGIRGNGRPSPEVVPPCNSTGGGYP
jgi:hypothetical protein